MSTDNQTQHATADQTPTDELPAEERAVFERLYERHDGDDIEQIAAAVLQSTSESDKEEAN